MMRTAISDLRMGTSPSSQGSATPQGRSAWAAGNTQGGHIRIIAYGYLAIAILSAFTVTLLSQPWSHMPLYMAPVFSASVITVDLYRVLRRDRPALHLLAAIVIVPATSFVMAWVAISITALILHFLAYV